jgi:hypothetical protein
MKITPTPVFYTYEENDNYLELYRYELERVELVPTDYKDETQATYTWRIISITKASKDIAYSEATTTDETLRGIPCDGTAYNQYADILTARANGNAS